MQTDQQIQNAISDQLKRNPILDSSGIGVSVEKGIVMLFGHFDSFMHKVEVERAVEKVPGVRAVIFDVRAEKFSANEKNDSEIADALLISLNELMISRHKSVL